MNRTSTRWSATSWRRWSTHWRCCTGSTWWEWTTHSSRRSCTTWTRTRSNLFTFNVSTILVLHYTKFDRFLCHFKPPKPKGPPPPFEFKLDLPPEGAEVPFVKNYEPPPPEPEPVPVPEGAEGGAWTLTLFNCQNAPIFPRKCTNIKINVVENQNYRNIYFVMLNFIRYFESIFE